MSSFISFPFCHLIFFVTWSGHSIHRQPKTLFLPVNPPRNLPQRSLKITDHTQSCLPHIFLGTDQNRIYYCSDLP
ncbi:hypothetical protein C8J56DRAFT_963284 [Mycena floridula]|nr:hypothetical protein C8J56DRAFT_963284 [Mycena floridula]